MHVSSVMSNNCVPGTNFLKVSKKTAPLQCFFPTLQEVMFERESRKGQPLGWEKLNSKEELLQNTRQKVKTSMGKMFRSAESTNWGSKKTSFERFFPIFFFWFRLYFSFLFLQNIPELSNFENLQFFFFFSGKLWIYFDHYPLGKIFLFLKQLPKNQAFSVFLWFF